MSIFVNGQTAIGGPWLRARVPPTCTTIITRSRATPPEVIPFNDPSTPTAPTFQRAISLFRSLTSFVHQRFMETLRTMMFKRGPCLFSFFSFVYHIYCLQSYYWKFLFNVFNLLYEVRIFYCENHDLHCCIICGLLEGGFLCTRGRRKGGRIYNTK